MCSMDGRTCMYMSMLHVQLQAAWTWTRSIDMGMQHILGLAAWTYVDTQHTGICSMGMFMVHPHAYATFRVHVART
jgi:hypothetical protein